MKRKAKSGVNSFLQTESENIAMYVYLRDGQRIDPTSHCGNADVNEKKKNFPFDVLSLGQPLQKIIWNSHDNPLISLSALVLAFAENVTCMSRLRFFFSSVPRSLFFLQPPPLSVSSTFLLLFASLACPSPSSLPISGSSQSHSQRFKDCAFCPCRHVP